MTTLTSEQQQPSPDGGGSFLDVRDLKVHFPTDDGIVKSVDGLSFHVERGKTLGIVGESGSGKSVTSMSVMGLHSKNAQISGSIRLDGQELVGASEETVRRLRPALVVLAVSDPARIREHAAAIRSIAAISPVVVGGNMSLDQAEAMGVSLWTTGPIEAARSATERS